MQNDDLIEQLEAIFIEADVAHHAAFAATEGVNPEWALWYADWLAPRLALHLCRALGRGELVYLLITADREQQIQSEELWPEFYARFFADRFAPVQDEALALYYAESCPYCRLVRRVIEELGAADQVELREIWRDRAHREALIAARGRATVPVLRCEGADGRVRWMPESADIIDYLRRRFPAPEPDGVADDGDIGDVGGLGGGEPDAGGGHGDSANA
jgi:glutaredoxin